MSGLRSMEMVGLLAFICLLGQYGCICTVQDTKEKFNGGVPSDLEICRGVNRICSHL